MYRIGIDVGGTFTDVTLLNSETGAYYTYKLSSTLHDQSEAIANGTKETLALYGVPVEQLEYFGHGTTVATNMIIERKGAKTALITTKGFRDLLEIGRQTRPSLYDIMEDKPETLVRRALRREVDERTMADGTILRKVNRDEVLRVLSQLKEKGVAIVFVTHFLEQVYAVCDRITVLRNGILVGEYPIEELPRVKLVAAMMGKDFDDLAAVKSEEKKDFTNVPVVIDAQGMSHKGKIKPFDLQIHKGEVVGLTGLLGSGRSELARVIYGADKNQTGKLFVNGKEAKINAPIDAMNLGMGLLPDDRKAEGIIADLSVRENIILAMQAKRGMFKLLPMSRQNEIADKYIELLQIKTASRETLIGQLSGGNQQKVILARWLATDPEFLILDEPTRGIDVGTKTEIQKLVIELADQGKSLIFISSEIEEMLRTCSKLVVLRDGQEVGEITEELTQGHVMQSIAGGGRNE